MMGKRDSYRVGKGGRRRDWSSYMAKTPEDAERTNRVVWENRRLVHFVGRRYRKLGDDGSIDEAGYDDLLSAGMMGLIFAARTHDPERAKLSTYAVMCISREMLRERALIKSQIYISSNVRARADLIAGIASGSCPIDR